MIRLLWLSGLTQRWTNIPWQVVRELVSLTSSLTVPGQCSQLSPTWWGYGCRHCVAVTCQRHFGQNDRGRGGGGMGRGVFGMLLQKRK